MSLSLFRFPRLRDCPDWAALPLLSAALLIALSSTVIGKKSWIADLAALLLAYSVGRIALTSTQTWPALAASAWRWVALLLGIAGGLVLGWYCQRWLWPRMQSAHPVLLMPSLMLIFVSTSLLPELFKKEIQRKADEVLKAEEIKHRIARQLLEARLAALQGQIEPHFLYNTLANARALIRQDEAAAENMLNHLIAYLRAAMPDLRAAMTTLDQELDRAQAYLEIMKIRLGERLQFRIEASEEARLCLIPPLGVMTLVENAIKHGIEPKPSGGRIEIVADCSDGHVFISVLDDGIGFQNETGDGIGLVNLQERLQGLFGETAELNLLPVEPNGVNASIRLPAQVSGARSI